MGKLRIIAAIVDLYPPSDPEVVLVLQRMQTCLNEIKLLKQHISKAKKVALSIHNEFQLATENTVKAHSPLSPRHFSFQPKKNYINTNFLNIKMTGANVWASIRDRNTAFESLPGLHLISSPQGNHTHLLHNSLVHLLKSSDTELLEAIDSGKLALEGEVGNLIIQRLKDIRHTYNNCANMSAQEIKIKEREKRLATTIITRMMGTATGDGLFKCDFEALYIELFKLALHAELHPDHKIVWLGTARSVCAIINAKTEIGIYLNCDDKRWTWHLNRLWLQAALSLGFRLELIEQHYPSIEDALLSRDGGARFVQELLRQVREDAKDTSQYNGYDAPTATAQEILVALDMRAAPQKGENNRIYLEQAMVLDDTLHQKSNCRTNNPLHHSWEGSFSAPTSPLKYCKTQFFVPEDSPELRKEQNKTSTLVSKNENQDAKSPTDVTMSARLSPVKML